jgi:hypothetical protein
MASIIPYILIGGAIAYMTVGRKSGNGNGKKNGLKENGEEEETPYLWISEDCSEVKIMGFDVDELVAESDDPEFVAMATSAGKAWAVEKLKIPEWFEKRPGVEGPALEGLTLEIADWAYPHCEFSETDMKMSGTTKNIALREIHSLVLLHAAEIYKQK